MASVYLVIAISFKEISQSDAIMLKALSPASSRIAFHARLFPCISGLRNMRQKRTALVVKLSAFFKKYSEFSAKTQCIFIINSVSFYLKLSEFSP